MSASLRILYFTQRSMMYFPETVHTTPAQAGLPEAQEVKLTASDGAHIIAWHVAPRGDKPVILYFHGNGGALRYRVERFRKLIGDGIGLVAVEYRGYGGSSGSPSEAGLIADAEAAYAFATARYRRNRTGPVGRIARHRRLLSCWRAEKPVGRVILEAPFTSAAAVAATTLLVHAGVAPDERPIPLRRADRESHRAGSHPAWREGPTVPYAMGERMFDLTKARKHIVRFLDGGHEDLDKNGALHAVGRFLAGDLDLAPTRRRSIAARSSARARVRSDRRSRRRDRRPNR